MCFVFIWEKTATCATYSINWLVFITEMKSVYCAVRTGSLNKAVCASSLKGITECYPEIEIGTIIYCNTGKNSRLISAQRSEFPLENYAIPISQASIFFHFTIRSNTKRLCSYKYWQYWQKVKLSLWPLRSHIRGVGFRLPSFLISVTDGAGRSV